MGDEAAITLLITQAVAAPRGYLRLENAEELITHELSRNRFNTERAVELYTSAINNSVRAWVKERDLGKTVLREYRRSGLGKKCAIELVERFKAQFRPRLEDQRRPRRFLRFLLGA
jgi:ribosomal protein S18 acetylase RimI-like enzyme